MCINCNLLTPLTDEAAEILGVAKRKYLVVGHETNDIMPNGIGGFSNAIHNFKTCSKISYSANMEKTVVKGITLYEGKLEIKGPLPKACQPPPDMDLYIELFTGDLVWAYEEEPVKQS